MPVINSIINWVITKRLYQIDFFRKYPCDVQTEVLDKLITRAMHTEWGLKYGYQDIGSYEDFKNRFPVQTYESLKPYIERLQHGEKNILWPSEIKWFAKSSGTTSDKSKFIPVSKENLEECHFRGGKDTLSFYVSNNPNTNIFKGKGLILGGSHQISKLNSDSYFGDLSAILIQNLPFYAHLIRTPDISITLMDDWEEKIDLMAKATIKDNVTNISGVPSWALVLFNYILEMTGKKDITEVWPNLELYMHGGVSFVPYREQFKKLIPSDKMNYQETYNASEGFFSIQDDPTRDDMLLMLDYGVFYEFIPMDEFDSDDPKVISLRDVEIGKNYALVISTSTGLWRYLIGDTVMFTSKYPFKIKITGRTKHFINTFGEEVIVENADKALKTACEKTGARITEYSAAPVFMKDGSQGRHQWLIEFEKQPENLDYFAELLDNALKAVNSDYEAKRYKNMNLIKPEVIIIKQGIFYKWLKEIGKLGGQHKVPRLSNNRKIADSLLELNK